MKPLLRPFLFIACLAPAWTLAQTTETPRSTDATSAQHREFHPRPTLTRATWTDLSGQWAFQKQPASTTAAPSVWGGVIQVPFCPESKLSGIEKLTALDESLWYQRDLPVASASGKRTLLHFEAVDYEATVWVNDKEVGNHTGGFTPFSFDITSALKATGNTLRVRVNDATEGYQLRGKQALQPKGITYTRVSGIWQTVWLEQVPQRSIQDLDFKTVLAKDTAGSATKAELQIRTTLAGPPVKGESVRVTVSSGGNEIAVGKGNPDLTFEISAPKLWTPDSPHLYQLKVELLDASGAIDTVQSYTALHPYTKIKFVYDWPGRRVARTVWQAGTSVAQPFKSNCRPEGNSWPIQIPQMPSSMDPNDYNTALDYEFNTGDGGINIHAGNDAVTHSSGCTILGECPSPSGNGQWKTPNPYQTSLNTDLEFKAALACARRVNPGIKMKTVVNSLPPLQDGPVYLKARIVFQ